VPAGAAGFYAERARVIRPGPSAVLDVVYHPWPTPLAQVIAQSGAAVVGGFDLLLHQASRPPKPLEHRPTKKFFLTK
jgi:shikimate dehydrogenase